MNYKKITLIILAAILSANLFSQITIKGIVKDGDTKKPISNALVNFYDFYGLDIYTSTNKDGEFIFENIKIEGETYDYELKDGTTEIYADLCQLTISKFMNYNDDYGDDYEQDFKVNTFDSTNYNILIYTDNSKYWDTVTFINDIAEDNTVDFGFSLNGYSPVIEETDNAFKFSPSFDIFVEGQAKIAKNLQLGIKFTYLKMAWINLNNDTLNTKLYHEKERYFSATTELFVFARYVTKANDSRGFFVDLGAGYSLPYNFKYTYYTDKYVKTSTNHIHKFNDFQAMFRIGFYAFDIKATYRLTDILKDDYIETPKLNIGIEFNIPIY